MLIIKVAKVPESYSEASRCEAPLAEAKNHPSALVARVEQREEIAITRRGVPVARLVPEFGHRHGRAGRREQAAEALERLQPLRAGSLLEGNLRLIAREGLD